ncbi:MAG: RagB/SusD family nutrient uptake outer membrane protein [Rikenellaceae bacterium]|nr:RagB/SusD family nutrient uptake outer membrane protein [Rikenellaceae bacterium]
MKKILLLALSVFALVGCTLEEKIISSSTPETYYQTEKQIETGLNGCYIPLKSIYTNYAFIQYADGGTDLMYKNSSDATDANAMYTPTTPRFGATVWQQGYLGVMRCNAMYAAIERSPLTEEEKAPLYAECVIVRAFFYYLLTIHFKDVPYYTEEVTDANSERIARLPRMSASDTRNALIDEICYWLEERQALPNERSYATNYRIGAAVGYMLAGKMCMWEKRWNDAIRIFGHLEDIYGNGAGNDPSGSLMQYPLSDIRFREKFTKESIFEIPATSEEYGLQVVGAVATITTPFRETSEQFEDPEDENFADQSIESDIYRGVAIPELGKEARTVSPLLPTKHFYQTLMVVNGPDRRCATYTTTGELVNGGNAGGYLAWGWHGWRKGEDRDLVPRRYLFFSNSSSASGCPNLGDKFWCPGMVYTSDFNNPKVFRFAGAILCLAEAHLRMGDLVKACQYLNAVKERAGIELVSMANFANADQLLKEIQDEAGRELFGEFNRRYDLIRWGIWYERVQEYSESTYLKDYTLNKPCREYYPIPDKQVVLSGGALDNNEYAKYGL